MKPTTPKFLISFCLHLCLWAALLLLAGCVWQIAPPPQTPPAQPPVGDTSSDLPLAVEYDLGETFLVQSSFTDESRFRNMPVRLNGLIAVPATAHGPAPVVVIFHGNHPGCPIPPGDEVDRWPCDVEVERPNYRGFDYMLRRLAAEGYVALSLNINAENTFGFGETVAGERVTQLVDLHLQALGIAAAGGANAFGVELAGRADLQRLALFGHSRERKVEQCTPEPAVNRF